MNLLSPKNIKELLARYNAAPLKRMGQNFLINPGILEKIIKAAALDRGDTVLEIGPGLGTLTLALAERAKKVIAIEKDKKMVEILKKNLIEHNCRNVQILNNDILKIDIESLEIGNWKLIANLPYYITSPVIRKFLETDNPPSDMILMVQKEVAQRICALPVRSSEKRSGGGRTAKMSLLSVSVQFYAEPKILSYVSKGSFWPSPKVDSAILRITPYSDPNYEYTRMSLIKNSGERFRVMPAESRLNAFRILFFKIVRAGFSAPRKQLGSNLAKGLKIDRETVLSIMQNVKIRPERRAETLSVEDWINITKKFLPNL